MRAIIVASAVTIMWLLWVSRDLKRFKKDAKQEDEQ